MKTPWDYTSLADSYVRRADYAPQAIDRIVECAGLAPGAKVCDIGAGAAHLTLALAPRGFDVVAIEPNDAMRAHGVARTQRHENVRWFEAVAERTQQESGAFDLVCFGSSFNVTDRALALAETARILRPGGWFACLWNHRDLDDPIQAAIQAVIGRHVPGYGHGERREDQTPVIDASGLFERVIRVEAPVVHEQTLDDCIIAWKSHATLQRQAGARFGAVIDSIEAELRGRGVQRLRVPYMTRAWVAQKRS